ncbi:brain protein I3 isoform X2 [Mobula hypostoma]|uniref:brain protein I3 isoform X2 n=1 Tax=Mobula hypostoma TaxID=723540 RepID=UPI002FC29A98
MDNKPLLQDRPPAYVPSSANYEYAQTYGTIPPPGYQQQPPPYSYPASGYVPPVSVGVQPPVCPTSNYSNTYTIIQQPTAASVVVVGGCPACSGFSSLHIASVCKPATSSSALSSAFPTILLALK